MNVIYKYPLIPLTINTLKIPAKCKFLHVGFQQSVLTLWVLMDTDSSEIEYKFWPIETGVHVTIEPFEWEYIGTAVSETLVWHVFHLQPIKH